MNFAVYNLKAVNPIARSGNAVAMAMVLVRI
jgi:hypothetical protein